MADITNNPPLNGRLQALLLARPIEVWTDDDAASGRAYTEQTPRPGLPVPGRASHARVYPGGTPTGTADLEARCQHGGLPGQVDHGMTVAVRRAGEPLHLGSETAGAISEHATVVGGAVIQQQDIVATQSGTLICAHGSGLNVSIRTKAPGDTSWTDRGAITTSGIYGTVDHKFPALVVIEDEVYMVCWRAGYGVDPAVSPITEVGFFLCAYRSTDDGATWEMVQDYASIEEDVRDENPAGTPASGATLYACGRIRAAYRDGEVIVVAHLKQHKDTGEMGFIRQWAGPGLTARLDHVADYQHGKSTARADVVATSDGFYVALLVRNEDNPLTCALGSAWQPISTGNPTQMSISTGFVVESGAEFTQFGASTAWQLDNDAQAGVALAYDPSGVVWLYTITGTGASSGAGVGYGFYSSDGGTTWQPGHGSYPAVTDISGYWYQSGDLVSGAHENHPYWLGATWWRGMAVLVHSSVGANDGDVGTTATWLGGWSDLTLPYEKHGVRIGHRMGWLRAWLPFERPEFQADYTQTTAGIFTSALNTTAGTHDITTGNGAASTGANWYQHLGVDHGNLQQGHAESVVHVTQSEGNGSTTQIGERMRLASTNHGCECEINRTATSIVIRDHVANTTLATVSGLAAGKRYAVRYGMSMNADDGAGRGLQVWWRLADGSSIEKRRWTRVGQWTLANDGGAGGTVPHYEWGHLVSAGAGTQNQSSWHHTKWSIPYSASAGSGPGAFANWHDLDQAGGDSPALLSGRSLGSEAVWAMDGFTLAGRRGPGLIGDTWAIPVTGDYAIDRAISLDVPSPRIHHRSVDVSSDVVIPWAVDPDRPNVEDTLHPPMMALRIWCNWRLGRLEYRTAAGAWVTSATIDTRVLQGASYSRQGVYLRASSTGNNTYLTRDEVDGDWTAEWDDGAGTTVYRHLAGNSPGRWSSATTEPRARLQLTSTAAGDPTSGGTLSLWSPHVVVLVPATTASAWRLVIDSTHGTADGDYRTKIAWCDAHILAQPPSWGRGFTAIPGHERVPLEGDVGVRVDRAPAAQELRIAWDDPVDETEVGTSGTVRAATAFTGGDLAASVGGLARGLVRALVRQAGRPVGWVVWDQTSGATVLRRRYEQLWGTAPSAPDVEVVLGDEGSTEVVRIATTTVREEL